MYLGIDVGGTKTLVATFDETGKLQQTAKFPTAREYPAFLEDLKRNIESLAPGKPEYAAVGIPATVIDREHGQGVSFGNLPWREVPIRTDVSEAYGCPVLVENDTKLAGLSEAVLLKDTYRRVVYITVSTGVGFSLVVDGHIDVNVGDAGGRALLLEHDGKLMPWEDFASGRAIVERYGKKASEIDDQAIWREVTRDLSQGLIRLIGIVQPEVIVIGGAVGTYFEKYGGLLDEALREYPLPLVALPTLRKAARPEEAVIYGCYELIRQVRDGNGHS